MQRMHDKFRTFNPCELAHRLHEADEVIDLLQVGLVIAVLNPAVQHPADTHALHFISGKTERTNALSSRLQPHCQVVLVDGSGSDGASVMRGRDGVSGTFLPDPHSAKSHLRLVFKQIGMEQNKVSPSNLDCLFNQRQGLVNSNSRHEFHGTREGRKLQRVGRSKL